MSLGSRTVQRGGRAIFRTACPASALREPLLFLYPQLHHPRFYTAKPLLQSEEQPSSSDPQKCADSLEPNVTIYKPLKDVESSQNPLPRTRGVHPTLKRLSLKAEERKAKEEYEDTTRRLYRTLRTKVEGIENYEVDWRTILSKLVDHTPQAPELSDEPGIKVEGLELPDGLVEIYGPEVPYKQHVKIEVPSAAIDSLLYHPENNIWSMRWRTDCRIEIPHKPKRAGETRTLLLYGLRKSISAVIQEIQSIASKPVADTKAIDSFRRNTFDIPTVPMILYVTDGPRVSEPESLRAAHDTKWTKRAFAYYVERLIKSGRQDPHRQVSETHTAHIRDRLNMLFEDPKLYHVISTYAFNLAMAYFIKTGQIKDARRLFVGMEMIGMEMQTETFNIMLRGAAKAHDLHNCRFLLGMMLKRGILPNAETWLAFLTTLTDFNVQVYVIAAMRQKGLLQRARPLRLLCRDLSSLETKWSIMKKQSLHDFIIHMDQRYGPHWLSNESANRILHQLALHGFFSRCCTFAEFMDSRLVFPNKVSLHTVISHCRIVKNFDGAIETLKAFQNLGVDPDAGVYQELFYMAMEKRLYSSARVVWRYACLNNATTFRMRKIVADSGASWIPPQSWKVKTPKDGFIGRSFWLHTAGKVILGNPATRMEHPTGHDRPALDMIRLVKRPTSKFSSARYKATRKNGRNIKRLKLWYRTQINLDLRVHQNWYPANKLYEILEKACIQDKKWNGWQIWFQRSLMWMFKKAVPVPMLHKSKTDAESGYPIAWLWE